MKRLILNIDPALHKNIKIRATEQNLTITNWVLIAIADLMAKREELDGNYKKQCE